MSHDDLKWRLPTVMPYFQRLLAHWYWNLKGLFMPGRALAERVNGKVVLLTGASAGIGELAARRLAGAGATVLLIARSKDKLEAMAQEIRAGGGKAYAYAANLAVMEDCDRVCAEVLHDHGRVDILINNAGRSIRRSVKYAFDRFHDYERTMQLNYFGAIRMAMNILPSMLVRNEGHIINVSTIGVQANPARFSAYLGSKWALEGWSWVAANEFAHTGIRISTLNYPLVRTQMIAPTKIYRYTPGILKPEKAMDWMMSIIITRNKRKATPLGYFSLLMYYVLPKTAESAVNFLYQMVHEPPPPSYEEIKKKYDPERLERARREAAERRTAGEDPDEEDDAA